MESNRNEASLEGRFSPELLDIHQQSGPWLAKSRSNSPVKAERFPNWDLDPEEGVIWFGDGTRRGLVARVHAIATFSSEERQFVWAWATEKLAPLAERSQAICAEHPEVPEFKLTLIDTDAAGAWLLSAAIAHSMDATVCFRLPGAVALFVGLTDLTELGPDDPRATIKRADPEEAASALAGFAGPAAIQLGAALYQAAQAASFDNAIAAIHTVADRLDAMGSSPVGKGTPAASEATALAAELRRGALSISLPPGHPELDDAILGLFGQLEATARHYGAVSGKRIDEADGASPAAE